MSIEKTLPKPEIGNGKVHKDNFNFFKSMLIGKKLLCRVWSDTGEKSTPKRLAKRIVKYGTPEFVVKIGGKKRFYKINYETKGLIKQDGNILIYDTHFSNSVGAFAFYEFPEAMDSDQAYTVFRNNAVDMYVKKGGIPFMYLLIAMAIVGISLIAIVLTVPAGLQAQEQVADLDEQVTTLKQQNAQLQTQITQLQNTNNISPNTGNGDNNLGSGFDN